MLRSTSRWACSRSRWPRSACTDGRFVTAEDRGGRAIVAEFFDAVDKGDLERASGLMHDEMVMEWPQSGERFTGRANVLGAMGAVELKPVFAGEPRLVGAGDVWVLMAPLLYGDDLQHYVAVLELQDGRIRRARGYWGAPFAAQAARAPFVDG